MQIFDLFESWTEKISNRPNINKITMYIYYTGYALDLRQQTEHTCIRPQPEFWGKVFQNINVSEMQECCYKTRGLDKELGNYTWSFWDIVERIKVFYGKSW